MGLKNFVKRMFEKREPLSHEDYQAMKRQNENRDVALASHAVLMDRLKAIR